MASVVEICNRALSHTGTDQSIVSLDERSKEARICARWYEQTRDQLLRAFAWNFADRQVDLAKMGEAPAGWRYRYRYPTDCVTLLEVYRPDGYQPGRQPDGRDPVTYQVASSGDGGRVILTNAEQAGARYTVRVTDPNLFPPDFTATLELSLAAAIAMPMTASPETANFMLQRASAALEDAMANNLNEGQEPPEPDAEWIRDRFGGA